jgi:AhpD family alkylhydroperoxidase
MMRLDYRAASPEPVKALAGVNAVLLRAGLERRFMNLLFLRVSQINGCSYCVDEHAHDLRAEGETNERLDGLAGWRESPYFTEAEKAALEWAEALTPCRPHPRARRSLCAAGAVFRRQDDRQHHLCRRADERLEPHRHRLPSGARAAPQMMGHSGAPRSGEPGIQ